VAGFSLLFFITLKPRVERYTKSMSLKYELASEPLHISVMQLFTWQADSFDLATLPAAEEGRYKATWTREFKLPWREAVSPNYLDDKVDSDQ